MPLPEPELWSRFHQDPRDAAAARLRASDGDRETALDTLAAAFSDGRLDRSEFDERADAVSRSRTLGALVPLLDDLVPVTAVAAPLAPPPVDLRVEAERAYEVQKRRALLGMLVPSLICTVIWFVSGFSFIGWHLPYPWPLFVIVGTGIRPLTVMLRREELVAEHLARLEKRRRRALEARRVEEA